MKAYLLLAYFALLMIISSSSFGVNGNHIAQVNGPGYEIAINETHAFVTNNNGVAVYNIQDPTDPERLGQINLGGEARGVVVFGDLLYIGALSRGLVIANISESPTDPEILEEYILSDYVTQVCIEGDFAFISSGFGEFQILDISIPSNPEALGHLPVSELTLDIATHDSIVYLAQPDSGLRLVDVNDLNSPQILTLVSGTSGARDLHVQGNLLYLARGSSGVSIFNISDSANPVLLGQYNDGGNSFGLHGASQYVCLADLENGVELIDISNPESPVEIAQYEDSAPHDLIYSEGYAYLADQDDEFLLIDIDSLITGTPTGGTDNSSQLLIIILSLVGVCAGVLVILMIMKKK